VRGAHSKGAKKKNRMVYSINDPGWGGESLHLRERTEKKKGASGKRAPRQASEVEKKRCPYSHGLTRKPVITPWGGAEERNKAQKRTKNTRPVMPR